MVCISNATSNASDLYIVTGYIDMGYFFLLLFLFSRAAGECQCWRRPVVADFGAAVTLMGWRSTGDAAQLRVSWSSDNVTWGRATSDMAVVTPLPARWVSLQAQNGTLVRVWLSVSAVTWGLDVSTLSPAHGSSTVSWGLNSGSGLLGGQRIMVGDSAALGVIWGSVRPLAVTLSVNGTLTNITMVADGAEAWRRLGLQGAEARLGAFVADMGRRGWVPVGWVVADVARAANWDTGLSVKFY